ncbi:MAG: S41 family peptidase [Bacteroidales bacterium]|nr:S41 family peptidase [Bacteroidales bacterium]
MQKRMIILLLALVPVLSQAQSKSFKMGSWVEIQNSIIRELNRSYVDSLPVDRMMRAGIDAMLDELDPYTVYVPEEENEDFKLMVRKSYGGLGAVIRKPSLSGPVIINEPYYGSPAYKCGVVCGDEVLAIDGESVVGLKVDQCSERMKGIPGTDVVLTMKKLRSGDTLDVRIRREEIHIPDIDWYGILEDGVTGYIHQTGFTDGCAECVRSAVLEMKKKGMKRLVIDLRGNGGGLLDEAVDEVGLFVGKGSVVVTSRAHSSQTTEYRTTKSPIDTKLPLIVMIDPSSASASEIVSGALQDLDRATIMGERSFGKGLVQSIRPLAYNGQLKVTTAKYYTPSGRCVQAIDYAERDESGAVKHIPDSLTNEFRTIGGRIVRDGGGITPDREIKGHEYSRISYALVAYAITDDFVLDYVRRHAQIAPLDKFSLSDADFEDFVTFASSREFDCRSSARTWFDKMKEELAKDGLTESAREGLSALEKILDMEKADYIRLVRDEIVPILEEEIAVRYYYQGAGVQVRLRYDDQLRTALTLPLIKEKQ